MRMLANWTFPSPIRQLFEIHGSENKHRLHGQFFLTP
jgi:hypothetical protein